MRKISLILSLALLCNACLVIGQGKHWDLQKDLGQRELNFYRAQESIEPKSEELEGNFATVPILVYMGGGWFGKTAQWLEQPVSEPAAAQANAEPKAKYAALEFDAWILGLLALTGEGATYSEAGKRMHHSCDRRYLLGLIYHDWESHSIPQEGTGKSQSGWSVLWGFLKKEVKDGKTDWTFLWFL